MKRLELIKAAIDFAYANYQAGAIELAEKSIAAFKVADGKDADLPIWTNSVNQNVAQFKQLSAQKLPSEVIVVQQDQQSVRSNASTAVEPATN
jgi:hypothetical protein